MASFQFKGLEEYADKISKMYQNTEIICGKATYTMADIVADKIRENIEKLDAVPDIEGIQAYGGKEKAKLTYSQKDGLKEGFGISPMQNTDGYYHVKLGFDGYNSVRTKKYPKGQPNVLIARSTESGSSVRDKVPFVRPAVNATKKKAVEEAKKVIDEDIEKMMK